MNRGLGVNAERGQRLEHAGEPVVVGVATRQNVTGSHAILPRLSPWRHHPCGAT